MPQKFQGGVERRDKSLRIAFIYRGETVRETVRLDGRALPPTPANIKYATRLAREIRAKIEAGNFVYAEYFPDSVRAVAEQQAAAPVLLFGQLAALWLKSQGKLEAATRDQYATAVRFWNRLFGESTPVNVIDHKKAEAEIGGYPWKSPSQHNNYMIAARGIFGMEYRGARAAESPVAEIENMPVVDRLPDPLTREERDKILADMRARYDIRVWAYFVFMFLTGMRPEEVIALRWSDIDLASGTARVRRVRTFKGTERDGSKTHADRDVDLVDGAMASLKEMMPFTYMLSVDRGQDDDTAADIFQNPVTRQPWHDERSQRDHYWKPTLKRLGIRHRRAYNTRHTYCTLALMAGIEPAYIALQAGHSVQMMLKKYARWIPGSDGGAAKRRLNAAMGGISPESPRTDSGDAKSLIRKGEVGRRDWTRTKKQGPTG